MERLVNLMFVFAFLLSSFFPLKSYAFWDIFGSECEKLSWTKEDSRTQGGGWVWFPGKGVAADRETAILLAEGAALSLLVQECQCPHKEIKSHERCVEEYAGNFRAYLRLSLLEKQCNETKYAKDEKKSLIENKELTKRLQRYHELTKQNVEKNVENCHEKGAQTCYDFGKYEYFMGNHKKAVANFNFGCQYGHAQSCFNAAMVTWELGDTDKATRYLELLCNQNDFQACYFLGNLSRKTNFEKSKKVYEKACDGNWGESCLALAEFEEDKSEKLLCKACDLKTQNGCHKASVHFYDKHEIAKAQEYAQKACDQETPKSCYNLAVIFENKDNEAKKKNLSKACEQKLAPACLQLAKISQVKDQEKLFIKACDLGEGEACANAAVSLFDKKQMEKSLLYSKYACKLGVVKSCHNAGYIEKQNGNNYEAKLFLSGACAQGLKESCQLVEQIKD